MGSEDDALPNMIAVERKGDTARADRRCGEGSHNRNNARAKLSFKFRMIHAFGLVDVGQPPTYDALRRQIA